MTIDSVEFCKALAGDTRQQILEIFLEGEMRVGDIVDAFTMSQPSNFPPPESPQAVRLGEKPQRG